MKKKIRIAGYICIAIIAFVGIIIKPDLAPFLLIIGGMLLSVVAEFTS